jgi:hypothetical protein
MSGFVGAHTRGGARPAHRTEWRAFGTHHSRRATIWMVPEARGMVSDARGLRGGAIGGRPFVSPRLAGSYLRVRPPPLRGRAEPSNLQPESKRHRPLRRPNLASEPHETRESKARWDRCDDLARFFVPCVLCAADAAGARRRAMADGRDC